MTDEPNNITALPDPEPPKPVLLWKKEKSPQENTVFLALSHAFGTSEGEPEFEWAVTPKLWRDRVVFEVRHSAKDLLPEGAEKLTFEDARQAQEWCERIERELGGELPEFTLPETEEVPAVADARGYAPTHKVLARWSRNAGILYLYRVWAKPEDPAQTQERVMEGDEYEAALVGFLRQKLVEEVAKRVMAGWTVPLSVDGPWGRMVLGVKVDFAEIASLTWHRPEKLRGNVSPRLKEITMEVQLEAPTHESVLRMIALLDHGQRLEMEAKVAGKSEDELRAEIERNVRDAGVTLGGEGGVLPVTIEDMAAVGIDPLKGVRP